MEARHVLVSGIVQGVGYRAFTKRSAERLGLSGWVRNLADGRVEVWLEGAGPTMEEMLSALAAGPESARVYEVRVATRLSQGANGFQQLPTGEAPVEDFGFLVRS